MNRTRWTIKWDPTADTLSEEMSGAYSQVLPLGKDRGALVLRCWPSSEEAWAYYEVALERVGVDGLEEVLSLAECPSITNAMEVGVAWALAIGWIGPVGPEGGPEWEILDLPAYLPQDVFSESEKWRRSGILSAIPPYGSAPPATSRTGSTK